jgi:hypothetical protein
MGEAFIYGRSGGGKLNTKIPEYSGDHTVYGDGKKGYMLCYTSGVLSVLKAMNVDVFMVNGGNGGNAGYGASGTEWGGAGGPGGRTKTIKNVLLLDDVNIAIGAGGTAGIVGGTFAGGKGGQTYFDAETPGDNGLVRATTSSSIRNASDGGTGGTAGGSLVQGANGASDGADGNSPSTGAGTPGLGQGFTTRAFEGDVPLFHAMLFSGAGGAGGGGRTGGLGGEGGGGSGGHSATIFALPGTPNTGGGGGGGWATTPSVGAKDGAAGGSGICIIRWGDWTEGM